MSSVEVRLHRWLAAALETPTERGAAVAVVTAGATTCAAGGIADAAGARSVRPDTPFPIACLGKPVLATLAGALISTGRLALDQSVRRLLPGTFPGLRRISPSIRLHHLMTHSSGLAGAMDFEDRDLSLPASAARGGFVRIAAPGEVYSYSSFGFVVLIQIIEAATDTDWSEALGRYLGEPLQIRFEFDEAGTSAAGHAWDEAAQRLSPRPGPDRRDAAGLHAAALDLQMTAGDLAKLARLHLDGGTAPDGRRLLDADVTELMHAGAPRPRCGSTPMSGLAWKRFAPRLSGHRGLTDGSCASLLLCRERRKGLICLANSAASTLSQRLRPALGFPRIVSEHDLLHGAPQGTADLSVTGCYRGADRFARVRRRPDGRANRIAMRFHEADGRPFADGRVALARIGSAACYVGKPDCARLPKGLLVEFIPDASGRIRWARVNGKALRAEEMADAGRWQYNRARDTLAAENAMDVRFPDIPLYRGFGAPQRLECDIADVEVVQGSVPRDLNGTLYRCGPDRQYPPMLGDDIFIDGEGMACRFRFDDGHVDFRSRWVRNERFLLQERARRSLFGRYRNRYTNDPSVAGKSMNTSNTHLFWHGGKLLVLKEDSLPIELDPDTLETGASWNFYGAVDAVSMTAHPKLDWERNEYLTFSYQARGDATTDFAFYVVDADGRVAHETWFEMPYPCMVHDFAITEEHVVVPFFPLITNLATLERGGPFYEWHPDEASHYAVLPRRGTADEIRWFKGPAVSAGHMMNAFTDGSRVHLDLCLYDGNCFEFFPSYDGSPWKPAPPLLTRLSFDLAARGASYAAQRLLAAPAEMPRCDDRYTGRPYRYGYVMCRPPDTAAAGGLALSVVGRIDHATGRFDSWHPGPDSGVQEPVFVPRRPGAAEGDGYLLVPVNRYAENRNDLVVLDAERLADGPLATLKLPVRIKSFHGSWAPADALRTGRYSP